MQLKIHDTSHILATGRFCYCSCSYAVIAHKDMIQFTPIESNCPYQDDRHDMLIDL